MKDMDATETERAVAGGGVSSAPSGGVPEEGVPMADLLRRCLSRWWWFALGASLGLCGAALYVLRTEPRYATSAEVQIKSDGKGSSLPGDVSGLGDMGLFSVRSNVSNELQAFGSPDLMSEVVSRLRLYMDYGVGGSFRRSTLYGASLPFSAELLDVESDVSAGFDLSGDSSSVELSGFRLKGGRVAGVPVSGSLGDTLRTPVGRVVVSGTGAWPSVGPVRVRKSGLRASTQSWLGRLGVGLADKQSDVISLSLEDVSPQRARDVLNTLISVYNEAWVRDKNLMANSTSVFIDDRLRVIEGELAGVDSDISAYKSENMIPDVGAAATMYMQQNAVLGGQLQEVEDQLYMARYIKDYMADEANRHQPLPANLGLSSQSIGDAIGEYNSRILQRNGLVANSGEENVLVRDLDQALASMRGSISRSVDNEIVALTARRDNLLGTERRNAERIAANPNQAKRLLSVERQQTVKQSLYLFLLQKREENELSQAFTAYNTRVIKRPVSGIAPVAPRSAAALLAGLLLGLAAPAALVYFLMASDTKVRGRRDLRPLSLPFLGEIPLAGSASGRRRFRRGSSSAEGPVVVRRGSRDVANEAFRVMRTNLEFMCGDGGGVVAMTSFNPGSGKSFLTANLGVCLAIRGRRVLMVDCDLRHGSLSAFAGSPKVGLADYLAGRVSDVRDVAVRSSDYPTLDTVPVGTFPPNPAELVAGPRLGEALRALRPSYDYILLDCPPVDIVTDARIVNRLADRTVFVVRAGLLDRSMVPELESLYRGGEYRGMCCALNGVSSADGYYGHYGRYGHYGHYGYYGGKGGSYYGSGSGEGRA